MSLVHFGCPLKRSLICHPADSSCQSGKLKKAVAVSEEKIQERSRRRVRFSSSHFPCRKMPGNFSSKEFRTPTAFSSFLSLGVCPPVLQELVLCVLFLHRWYGSCRQQIQANVQGPMKQNASPGEESKAPRRRWKAGQEQHPGPENQESQHTLNQPRGSFPESWGDLFKSDQNVTSEGENVP